MYLFKFKKLKVHLFKKKTIFKSIYIFYVRKEWQLTQSANNSGRKLKLREEVQHL